MKNTIQLSEKEMHVSIARMLLVKFNKTRSTLDALREHAASVYGDSGQGFNRFPIAGGVCDHWPRPVINFIVDLKRESETDLSLSLAHWKAAGRHASTWRREKTNFTQAGT